MPDPQPLRGPGGGAPLWVRHTNYISSTTTQKNIQDLTMFRCDQGNACPFSVQGNGSQHHRIIELENALQSRSEEVIYLRTQSKEMHTHILRIQELIIGQQQNYQKLEAHAIQEVEKKNLMYQKLLEIKEDVKVLERENAIYKSIENMRQLK